MTTHSPADVASANGTSWLSWGKRVPEVKFVALKIWGRRIGLWKMALAENSPSRAFPVAVGGVEMSRLGMCSQCAAEAPDVEHTVSSGSTGLGQTGRVATQGGRKCGQNRKRAQDYSRGITVGSRDSLASAI